MISQLRGKSQEKKMPPVVPTQTAGGRKPDGVHLKIYVSFSNALLFYHKEFNL